MALAFITGFAVVRGIEAALGLPDSMTPLLDKRILDDVREREKRDAKTE